MQASRPVGLTAQKISPFRLFRARLWPCMLTLLLCKTCLLRDQHHVIQARPHLSIMQNISSSKSFLCAFAFTGLLASATAATPPAGFTPLFNGKDLAGWRGGD